MEKQEMLNQAENDEKLYEAGKKKLEILLKVEIALYFLGCVLSVIYGDGFNLVGLVINALVCYFLYEGKKWIKYFYVLTKVVFVFLTYLVYRSLTEEMVSLLPYDVNYLWFSMGVSLVFGIFVTLCLFCYPPIVFYLKVRGGDYFLPKS